MKKLLVSILALALLLGCVSAQAETAVPRLEDIDTSAVNIDPANPLGPQFTGLYSFDVALEGGARQLYHYVPETLTYRQPAVAIGVPTGEDALAFAEATGWKALADEQGFSLILMLPGENGWADNDAEYVNGAFGYMDARTWLQMQDSAFYMVGYGDSANSVMAHVLNNSELLAGFAAFGVDNFDTALLDAAKAAPSALEGVSKAEVNIPAWFGANEKNATVEALTAFWKNCNDVNESNAFSNAFADEIYIFRPELALDNDMTDQNVAQVRVTLGLDKTTAPEFTNELWNSFLRRVRRQDSETINGLRAFATNEELGMERVTLEVNGVTREMWIFQPTAVKNGLTNVPVVFVAHGGGGSGEEFNNRTGWSRVAEERNFVVVFMTGSRSNQKFKASTTWQLSDLDYWKAIREYVLANYSMIDATRVYVTGHSMGDLMAHYIGLYTPELVAAIAPNDALVIGGIDGLADPIVENIVLPYMLNIGTLDYGFVPGGMNDGLTSREVLRILARYGITATEEETYQYQNGRYHGYVWTNHQGIPVAKEQWVDGKIHAMIPEECYTIYDFLANYSRGADGTSYYMGVAIELQ